VNRVLLKSKKKIISFSSAFLIITGILYYLINGNIDQKPVLGANEAIVLSVNDGDTIKVNLEGKKESIRLIGLDAPEIDQERWGKRAYDKLYSLVPPGSLVTIEFDVTKRDKYNRLLGYVFTKDGRFVNEIMLRDGLAVLYTFPPNVRYTDRFRKAQFYARERALGIWGKDGLTMSPQEYRKSRKK